MSVACFFRGFEDYTFSEHITLQSGNLKAVNTVANPDAVVPYLRQDSVLGLGKGEFSIELEKASWNVIRFKKTIR